RALFGQGGYGLDPLGTEETVQAIQVSDLKNFHQTLTRPNNCVLAIFGDIKTDEARAAVENAFSNWKSLAPRPSTPDTRHPTLDTPSRISETRDKKQAVLLLAYQGTTLHDSDRYRLDLLQEACSDLGSRLFLRIREQLGLAYFVGAQNFLGLLPGYF